MDSWNKKEMRLEQLMPLIREMLDAGKTVKFSPRGVSMLPLLRQGQDNVILSPVPDRLKKYDLPLYQRDDGSYILHRVVAVGETYTCVGDNQFELEHGLRQDQMIALVTAIERNGKVISVTDWRYGLYCRLWHCSRPFRHVYRRVKNRLRRYLQ